MTSGVYINFLKEYFDVYTNEWKFDVDTADVKVMFLTDEYCPHPTKHTSVGQIKKYELNSGDVEIKVKGEKIIAPNGYETGGKSVGGLLSTQHTQQCLNHRDEWENVTTTTLITKEKATVWGSDSELEKYPYRATFDVGATVFYLNNGIGVRSPLISYFLPEGNQECYKGTYNMIHNSNGFMSAHVNESHKPLFKVFGVHWSPGFTCRKKKRGE
jgi:hypothetical protein